MAISKVSEDRKDTRYRFRIHNPYGKQYDKVHRFEKHKDAKVEHDRIALELRTSGRSSSLSSATPQTSFGDWAVMRLAVRVLKPNARLAYRNTLKNHLRPRLGHLRLEQLETATTLLQAAFKEVGETAGPGARHRFESLVRELLGEAHRQGLMRREPLASVPMFKRAKPKGGRGISAPTMLECVAVDARLAQRRKSVVVGGELMQQLILRLQLGCGLRIGEAVAIDWDADIDVKHRTLHVQRQAIFVPEHGHIFADPKKSSDGPSIRKVVIPQFTWDALLAVREHIEPVEETLLWNDHEAPKPVYRTQRLMLHKLRPGRGKDRVYSPTSWQEMLRRFNALEEPLTAEPLHSQAFRHRYTRVLRDAGVPLPTVDDMTGHKSRSSLSDSAYGESTPQGRKLARAAIQSAWEAALRGEDASEEETFAEEEFAQE